MGSESHYMNFVAFIVSICGTIWLWYQGTEMDFTLSKVTFGFAIANLPFGISWLRYFLDDRKARKAKENRVGLK